MQNTSHAVMAQRIEPKDSPDDFPTPPWATRGLLEHIIAGSTLSKLTCLEPACGAGHMAKVLKEYFKTVHSSDAFSYGYGEVRDFVEGPYEAETFDWVITNPPFRLAEDFVRLALPVARKGVAILARTVFLESIGRYQGIFREAPPTKFAQFVERVPMVRGRLDIKATTATGYAWLVWEKGTNEAPRLTWVIEDASTPSDNAALARIENRIDTAVNDLRHRLSEENAQLLRQLDARNFSEVRNALERADVLRDEFNQKLDTIRADMLAQVYASASTVMRDQQRAILISAIVTAIAAILGLVFAVLVSSGITRPVHRLLEGTREVEAGHLEKSIDVTTRDEIGQLSVAFNRMIERLRHNERIRETFGRYIDPRVAQGLLDQPALAATEGQRRVMTVMFCDMKGFTTLSEGVTPQGLVKVMNRYLSTMSEPIRGHRGIIDKYIGDAIMAYWGPPFIEEADQAHFACLAAIDMIGRIATLRKELPELLGLRTIPMECDVRIGIATGEALVGSIGSEVMMSYTVMGDTVNLASRLEAANKLYGTRSLVSEATIAAAGAAIEVREIDRLVVVGQTQPQVVFEIMGRAGELAPKDMLLRTQYSEGLAAYRARRWDEARSAFNAALEAVPDDGPSMTFAKRIDNLREEPPPADWDGSWRLDRK